MVSYDVERVFQERIGELGPYQFLLVMCLTSTSALVAIHSYIMAFTVDQGCRVEELQSSDKQNNTLGILSNISTVTVWTRLDESTDQSVNAAVNTSLASPTVWGFLTSSATIKDEWQLYGSKEHLATLSKTLHMTGCLVGSILLSHSADRFGRKTMVILTTYATFAINLAAAWSPWFELYVALRFLIGVCIAGLYNAAYILAIEIVGPSYRALVTTFMLCCNSFGMLFLTFTAYTSYSWRLLHLTALVPMIPSLFYKWILPESPRWLLSKSRTKEATDILMYIARKNKKELDTAVPLLETIPNVAVSHASMIRKSESITDVLYAPRMMFWIISLFFVWFSVSNAFYGLSLNSANIGSNIYLTFLLLAVVEIPAYCVVFLLRRCYDYRSAIIICNTVSGAILLFGIITSQITELEIVLAMLGKFCLSVCFCCLYPYSAEIFPTSMRSMGLGLTASGARVGAIVSAQFTMVADKHGASILFITFGVSILVSGLLMIMMPISKNQQLPETIADSLSLPSGLTCCSKRKSHQYPADIVVEADSKVV